MPTQFESNFQSVLSDGSWNPAWLKGLRELSYEGFVKAGLPTRQNEDWKYTSTRPFSERAFALPKTAKVSAEALEQATLPGASRLVFINGIYDAALSMPPAELSLTALNEAEGEEQELIRAALSSEDALSLLNQALFTSGVLIRIKKGLDIKAPVQLLYLQGEAAELLMISPRNLIFVEGGARVTFLESHHGESGHFTNCVTDVFVKDNAECQYVLERVLRPDNLFVGSTTFHIGRDARVETFNLALGGQINRCHLSFRMKAEGAHAKLDGLYLASDGSHIDNVTEVLHLAPNTSSAQLYKGILEGKSRAIFNGKITIVKDAQRVDAQQLNKNLLLSPDAEVDSRPQLVIDANDVKCSHGATIGQIDAQELFYLQSRAIAKDDAKRMLAKAFVGDVLGRVRGKALEAHLESTLEHFGSRA